MNDSTVQVTKRCSKCGEERPANEAWFYADKAKRDGLSSGCRECTKAASRARHHDPDRFRRPSAGESLCRRFWQHVPTGLPSDVCWEWTGRRQTALYGHGTIATGGKSINAHRVSWMLNRGAIPDGLWVLHRCDNPPCVNPAHLFLGTNLDNIRDCVAKGRHTRGEKIAWSKLTEADVRLVRALAANGVTITELARRYDCWPSNINDIVRRRTWKHVI